ncbi:FG-GAP repeat domain-containing protein [Nonomuraea fuscirosea]|uniref:FG-GAP repeat domain-containing protein n=1 Tax=Nonomuraea fuscirosea TaxID=1291556 RepID=UPI0034488D2A
MARKLGLLLMALALTGCSATGPATDLTTGPAASRPTPSPGASAPVAVTPAASSPPRTRCSGKAEPGDLNGDGYADLAFIWTGPTGDDLEQDQLVVVNGSMRGLEPATAHIAGRWSMSAETVPQLADLDGDGCADIIVPDSSLLIYWGGRGTPTFMPYGRSSGLADLDGDDATDLMAAESRGDDPRARVFAFLHGPFTRSGEPARKTSRPVPEGDWPGALITDPHGPEAVLYGPDDGGQADAALLKDGGFRKVARGGAAVFGDFDGDGRRDVAIGDSGARDDEPGMQTEDQSVESITRVFYGGDREPQVLNGIRGSLAAGDLNGDGLDDLVSGEVAGASVVITGKAEVLFGSPRGLHRTGVSVTHHGPTRSLTGKRLKEWRLGSVKTWAVADYDGDGRDELLRVWRGGQDYARFWRVDAEGRTLQVFDLRGRPSARPRHG